MFQTCLENTGRAETIEQSVDSKGGKIIGNPKTRACMDEPG